MAQQLNILESGRSDLQKLIDGGQELPSEAPNSREKTSLAGYGDDEFHACRVGGADGKL